MQYTNYNLGLSFSFPKNIICFRFTIESTGIEEAQKLGKTFWLNFGESETFHPIPYSLLI